MTSQIALAASERITSRTRVERSLKSSLVPANLFSQSHQRASLLVNRRELQERISPNGRTQILLLRVGDKPVIRVLARHLQHSPISGQIVHVDFYEVA